MTLSARSSFKTTADPAIEVEVRNTGSSNLGLNADNFTILLPTRRNEALWRNIPDGPSYAALNCQMFGRGGGTSGITVGKRFVSYSFSVDPPESFPDSFTLKPGSSRHAILVFQCPPGEYQFLFSYGSSLFMQRPLVSNRLDFDVDEHGGATLRAGTSK